MAELDGVAVLVTRERTQAHQLLRHISDAGGRAHCIATVAIEPVQPAAAALQALRDCDCAIFISINAVRHGAAWLQHTAPRLAAVGAATGDALRALGYEDVMAPHSGHGGAALLALPALQQVRGWRVVVVRGENGLVRIQRTMQARGAIVEELHCYRRVLPQVDLASQIRRWQHGSGDGDNDNDNAPPLAATVTSVTHLDNLFALADDNGRSFLRQLVFITAGERIAQACRRHRPALPPVVADGASDEAMMRALLAWRAQR